MVFQWIPSSKAEKYKVQRERSGKELVGDRKQNLVEGSIAYIVACLVGLQCSLEAQCGALENAGPQTNATSATILGGKCIAIQFVSCMLLLSITPSMISCSEAAADLELKGNEVYLQHTVTHCLMHVTHTHFIFGPLLHVTMTAGGNRLQLSPFA